MFPMCVMLYLWRWSLPINMQERSISVRAVIWSLLLSAGAGQALNKAFGVPMGEAFGFMAGSPAAIGLVMADTAMKSASLSIARYMTPDRGTSHSNEVILAVSRRCQRCKNSSTECQTDWSGASDRNGQLSGDPRDTLFIKKS